MGESSIPLPEGLSGPLARSSKLLINGINVHEIYEVYSAPWRVDRSFEFAHDSFGGSITNIANWPFLIGCPGNQPASTGIVIRRLKLGIANLSAGTRLILHVARASSPAGGTTTWTPVKSESISGASVAGIRSGATATKGPVRRALPFYAPGPAVYDPLIYEEGLLSAANWLDRDCLLPGEYIGAKFELSGAAAQPNGNERLFVDVAWSEVTW